MIMVLSKLKKEIKALKHNTMWLRSLQPMKDENDKEVKIEVEGIMLAVRQLELELKKLEASKFYELQYEEAYGGAKKIVSDIKEKVYGKEE